MNCNPKSQLRHGLSTDIMTVIYHASSQIVDIWTYNQQRPFVNPLNLTLTVTILVILKLDVLLFPSISMIRWFQPVMFMIYEHTSRHMMIEQATELYDDPLTEAI